ncbi:L-gulonolactone oxidase-like [Stylophora pistillata]|nr:L-gulonolactone oxidase-like [Stylophora pistillata]
MEQRRDSGVEEILSNGQRGYLFTNWAKTFSCTPELFFEPETIEDIRQILYAATQLHKTVRVVGGGHSPSDIACTDGYMISLKKMKAVLEIDYDKKQVTVEAGLMVNELNELLDDHGLALPSLSSVSEMSCAGAIGTCTHGSGKNFGIFATSVVSLELMTANGKVIYCSREKNKEIFLAALCGLGAVGIILSLTWQCEKAFNLQETTKPLMLEEMLENLESSLLASDHFKFHWYPHTGYVKCYEVNRTTKPIDDTPSWFWDYAVGFYTYELVLWLSSFVPSSLQYVNWAYFKLFDCKPHSRVNQSHKVFNFNCLFKQYVTEWAIPQDKTVYVLRKLQSWLNESGFHAHAPAEVRFVKRDDIYLSPCYEQDTCFINVISYRPL